MATLGPFYWLDRALLKVLNGTINLESQAVKAALVTSSQAITRTFTGTSGDARYADITAELTTANGYTAGGISLSSISLSRLTVPRSSWTSSPFSWTITGAGITFKYCVLYVDGATNKDILMACDMDTGGGSVTAIAGPLQFGPSANGWGYWEQP